MSLYNALHGTQYSNPDDLEINTLDDAVYMKMKNDVSFILSSVMSVYEHQSTFNPNMPFREFEYCAKLYDKYISEKKLDIYGSSLVKIPAPNCYVFYNGLDGYADRTVLKLSDAFEVPSGGYEWTAVMLNINKGHNDELMDNCRALDEYAYICPVFGDAGSRIYGTK